MQRSASPAAIVVAVIVLIVVVFVIYKFTLGKKPPVAQTGTVPQPGSYQQGMPGGGPAAAGTPPGTSGSTPGQ
ncbi:MAG: hypothetical protein J7M26_04235 [Armatimonadetes bacterium]|nr:hypothetical protein [Armatimonadota bacterium]